MRRLSGAIFFGLICSGHSSAQGSFSDSRCSFAPSVEFSVGTNPYAVAVGDLQGDGKLDFAVANEGSNDVSILFGTGLGSFTAATSIAVGNAPRAVLLEDLNADGKRDLIVANYGSNTVTIGFGNGAGAFDNYSTLAVGSAPRALAVADLNMDGKPDLVTANGNGNSVTVLMATSGGAFAAGMPYSVGGNPASVAVADFNADGNMDLAVANEAGDSVSILLGNAAGTFGAAMPYAVGSQPRAVVTGDFDTDGELDLAVANWNSGSVSVLLGSGAGAFGSAVSYAASALPTAMMLTDFDADGAPELVVANETSAPNIVTVLRGLEAGTYAAPTAIPVGGVRPRGLASGDFNADGNTDLVVADYGSNQVSILLGDCAPLMKVPAWVNVDRTSSYELRKSPIWFDRTVSGAYTHVVTHLDLNRDGRTDLFRASVSTPPSAVEVLMNAGDGTFVDQTGTVITNAHPPMVYPRKGLSGDYNGDGWPDVLVLDTGLDVVPAPGAFSHLYLSRGDGTLHYSSELEPEILYNHGGASADIDGNGTVDVLMSGSDFKPYFLINDGLGHFTRNTSRLPTELLIPGTYIVAIELVDIDRDGYIDILCAGNEFTAGQVGVVIYWGSSSGLYRPNAKTVVPKPAGLGGVLDFAVEDIDNDGRRDIIVSRFSDFFAVNDRYFQILRQISSRQFADETAARITMNFAIEAFDFFRVQDFNGDDALDIFIDDRHFASIGEYAWINNGQGVFTPYAGSVNPLMPSFANGFE